MPTSHDRCDTAAKTFDGRSASELAVANGHTAVVELLPVLEVRRAAAVLRAEVGRLIEQVRLKQFSAD